MPRRPPSMPSGIPQFPSSQPSQFSGPLGTCAVCGGLFKTVLSSGVIWIHGGGGVCCPGSKQLPGPVHGALSDPTIMDQSSQAIPGAVLSSSPTPVFVIDRPPRPVLSHIPKGARLRAAAVLEERLRAVISSPEDLVAWSSLLHIASSLSQPVRGGSKHSFTSQIINQLNRIPAENSARPDIHISATSKKRIQLSEEDLAIRRASIKIQEGDVRGAARCLASEERLAPSSPATSLAMRAKHPPCPSDRRSHPTFSVHSLTVTGSNIKAAIKSFKPGSAGGRDGLKPQNLKDLADVPGNSLCDALADFANLALRGGVPSIVRPSFFGATLLPFVKKSGGLRPVAVGLTLRRLVAKAASSAVSSACASFFAPFQLGVGTKGGAEALAHAVKVHLDNLVEGRAFVKLDFSNAFNSVRRDCPSS